ncbi:Ldh family oxidoreductase [Sinorhizobium meliloti]|uniref:Ldh family oxidoreductase n=1 Tax=Rhizobium meliloti TaxID=382 RepID=UPI003D64CA50
MSNRYDVGRLGSAVMDLFAKAGLDGEKATATAQILIEADLIGHTTHGLALAPWYLEAIEKGGMAKTGEPQIRSDRGACIAWDGKRLPGLWLTAKAVDLAVERVTTFGTVTVAIGNGHHIGCLAAYLQRATDRGLYIIVASSSPSGASVAPFGGTKPIYTPNPIAIGVPTRGDPILIDISASITTQNMTSRLVAENRPFDHPWLMEADGQATTDPNALARGGSLLPVGGFDHGQKGYGLALMIETLTQGLSGIGRADGLTGTNASVLVQVLDPSAFGG